VNHRVLDNCELALAIENLILPQSACSAVNTLADTYDELGVFITRVKLIMFTLFQSWDLFSVSNWEQHVFAVDPA
jgi:hypothetical protein